ncbi:hypothetical protein ES703_79926 [subsurface metagenome]
MTADREMMKRNNSIFIGWQVVILALAVVLCGLLEPAYCETDGTALLLQQTPPQGGKITPGVGVHHFEPYAEVTLTAVPKPGYQFVYWMGDVSDPTANSTIVYLDAPKIVIAVFERVEYDFLAVEERPQSRPVGGLVGSAGDYARTGGGGGIGRRPSWPSPPEEEKPEEKEEDFPVPPEGNDFPVPEPIPEPATAALLVLGSLFALARRDAKSNKHGQ